MSDKITIIIADDNKIMCEFLKKEIERHENIEILGIANTNEDEIKLIEELKPEIVITDLMRNGEYTGLKIIKDYAEREESPQFLIISAGVPCYTIMGFHNVANFFNKLDLNYTRVTVELENIKQRIIEDIKRKEQLKLEQEKDIKKKNFLERLLKKRVKTRA